MADPRAVWLSDFICAPDHVKALAIAKAVLPAGFRPPASLKHSLTLAIRLRGAGHLPAAWAWQILSIDRSTVHTIRTTAQAGVKLLREHVLDADVGICLAHLRVWREIAAGDHGEGADFFVTAHLHNVAAAKARKQAVVRNAASALVNVLLDENWFEACETAINATVGAEGLPALYSGRWMRDRILDRRRHEPNLAESAIGELVNALADAGLGELSLCWRLLLADVTYPPSIWSIMPALRTMWEMDMLAVESVEQAQAVNEALAVWQLCAEGVYVSETKSVFELVRDFTGDEPQPAYPQEESTKPAWMRPRPAAPRGPSVVVLPSAPKLNSFHSEFKDLIGLRVPLVVANDVAGVRARMSAEFPHAIGAVDLLTLDLREGEPVRLAPVLLVGPPGRAKSTMVRILANSLGLKTSRFDCASASDAMFGGSPRAWGNTTPSIPVRAVNSTRQANPLILLDEIEKAGTGNHNGSLFAALTGFLERETSARYHDVSLDAPVDLSAVNYIATANDDRPIPDHIRDRFRIVRVPAPTLAHLPALAANLVAAIEKEEGSEGFNEALADDELAVIATAWSRSRFSLRTLQRIVKATLDARQQHAMRH
jgi:hypothetical protein